MYTQKHFPRAILSVLLVCCLLASLAVPASAITNEEYLEAMYETLVSVRTAATNCRAKNDETKAGYWALGDTVSALEKRVAALEGVSSSALSASADSPVILSPVSSDDNGVSVQSTPTLDVIQSLYSEVRNSVQSCRTQSDQLRAALHNYYDTLTYLEERVAALEGVSSSALSVVLSSDDTSGGVSTLSAFDDVAEQIGNLQTSQNNCRAQVDENAELLSDLQSRAAQLDTRLTALENPASSKLPAPTVTLSGDRLSIAFDGDESVTTFAIYVDGELSTTVYRTGSITDFALSDLGLSYGDYQITVAGGKAQTILTETSNAVSYSYAANIQAGQWVAKESLLVVPVGAPAAWPSDLSSTDISFRSGGVTFSRMSVGTKLGSFAQYLFYDDTPVYCYGDGVDPAGWVNEAYAYVYLSADVRCVDPFYSWFTSSYLRDGDTEITQTYKTTVNVYSADGSTLLWSSAVSASWLSPAGTVSITDTGLTFTCGGSVYTYEHTPADGYSLHGFSVIVGGSTLHLPGASISVGGAPSDLEYNFYAVEQIVVADKEYKAGILGWFERLWDAIAGLPKKFAEALMPSWLSNIFSDTGRAGGIGATVSEFFSTAWDKVTSLFGLTDLWDDPTGPFAWLKE